MTDQLSTENRLAAIGLVRALTFTDGRVEDVAPLMPENGRDAVQVILYLANMLATYITGEVAAATGIDAASWLNMMTQAVLDNPPEATP